MSFVVQAGASAKEAQELARHSTPTLTMNVYARAQRARLAELTECVAEAALNGAGRAICVSTGDRKAKRTSPNPLPGQGLHDQDAGGGYGARTRGLDNAIVALSQLS